MGDASYLQADFLGGIWSSYFQGRVTDPDYRKALKVCTNAVPMEEGAVTRRPGTRFIAFTKAGAPAAIWKFGFTSSAPYVLEFTPGFLRLSYGPALVLEPNAQSVTSFSAPPAWAIGTTYAANAVVQGSNGHVYLSIAGGNVGNDPVADFAEAFWTFVGPAGCLVTTESAHGYQDGNEVEFFLPPGDLTDFGSVTLLNRQFVIQIAGPTAFMILDSVTGAAVSPVGLSIGPNGLQVACILMFATPYAVQDLAQIRVVQAIDNEINQLFVFHPKHQPLVLTAATSPNPALNVFGTFNLTPATFQDGPYLDPPASGATLTPTGLTGTVTLDVTITAWDIAATYGVGDVVSFGGAAYTSLIDSNIGNEPDTSTLAWQVQSIGADVGPSGFVASDVGRMVRLFSEPAQWVDTTGYNTGNVVKFDGAYWTALQNNTNKQPGLDVVNWAVNPTGAVWTWGRIQTVASATEVTVQLRGGALLYTTPIQMWQMGRYSNTTGWPSNGTYDEQGRLWIIGGQGNHFDGSMSNQTLSFSPTAQDGTVADNNAVAETLNDKEVDAIFWLMNEHGGIVLGTQGGEWLLQASALNEPITPTSVQARKVTKYGMENIQPEHCPLAFMAVQRYARKLLEYIADPYTGKYSATNLGIKGAEIIQQGGGIAKIAYQQERAPVIWAQLNDGTLAGMTYHRDSPFGTQPATFAAWHQHILGSGNLVTSITGGAAPGGETDCLTMVTQNQATGLYQLELMTDFFDEDQDITDAWYLDAADLPFLVQLNPAGLVGVRLYGYHYLAGQTVQVWAAGLDMGDLAVAADGHIDVPFGSDPNGLFTLARLQSISTDYQSLFPDQAIFISNGVASPPGMPDFTGLSQFPPIFGTMAVPAIDWTNGVLYANTSNGATVTYTEYSITTREPLAHFPSEVGSFAVYSGIVSSDGNIYAVSGESNGNPFVKAAPNYHHGVPAFFPGLMAGAINGTVSNGSFEGSFTSLSYGSASSSTTSSATHTCVPRSATTVFAGSTYYVQSNLVGATGGTNKAQITVIDAGEMQFQNNFVGGESCANVVAGRQVDHGNGIFYAEVFSIQSSPNASGDPFSQALEIWRLAITRTLPGPPIFSWVNFASVTAAQIDPTWTQFNSALGIAWDTTDDNIIAWITSPAGPVNTTYLYKLNSTTGAVMWKIPMPSIPVEDMLWPQSLIQGGRLAVLVETGGQNSNLYWIDTIGGTIIQTTPLVGLVGFGSQAWGPQGLILFHGDFEYISPHLPAPIAPTPATGFGGGTAMFLGAPAVPAPPLVIPVIAGYTYTTKVQILRPIAPQEAGSQNGPALGKTRRTHHAAYLFHGAQGVQFGTDFGPSLHACNFMLNSDSTIPLPITALYNDVYWDSIEDDYSFNGQPSFQVTRPYPTTCLAIEAFLHTQDR